MANIPPDPLEDGGIARFADEIRAGRVTSEAVTTAYLARIEALMGASARTSTSRGTARWPRPGRSTPCSRRAPNWGR